jgi:phenylacetate-CoA ligase
MPWNPEIECMPREKMQEIQLSRLQETVRRAYERVPLYKRLFDEKGIKPEDIRSLNDLQHLPFTTKTDFRDNYPFGMFAVPMDEVVRIHASSGTTGKPTVVGYTQEDIDLWAELIARTLGCVNATSKDVVQVAYGYGLFTGGLGVHYGAEKLKAAVIPISGGNTKRQLMLMQDFGATILACTPSYALHIAEFAEEIGIDTSTLKLRAGVFGAEPWSEQMRQEIQKKLNIDAIDIYGLSEVLGPGVASECLERKGLHVFDDHFIPEVIDPETGEVLPPGENGELVFTSLSKRALPIIRYRTRDITMLIDEPCACGRTHVRIARIAGRTDDMLIIRGVNVFPSQIESVIFEIADVEPHYQIVVDRRDHLDEMEVWVEVSEKVFSDEVRRLEELQNTIRSRLNIVLGINVTVKLVEPKSIQRSEGKAKRVIDKREL